MTKGPSIKTVKRLFAASGGWCAFPGCKTALTDQDSDILLAEMCHIHASSSGGPPYHPDQPDLDRHGYANLILLCPTHHAIIDQAPDKYTADVLARMKVQHETAVRERVASLKPESLDIEQANRLARQVQEESVDFVIVVALEKELQAVLKEFPNLRLVQNQDVSTRSYYYGEVEANGGVKYRLVITLLSQMGNLEAAHATNDLIRAWNPRYILVVGIAGGLKKEEQDFGDIVVSDSVVYYEPAKARPTGLERRARHFPSDPLLLDRAKNMTDGQWRIGLPERPDARAPSSEYPKVFFGPIGSGEKVIASEDEASALLQMQPNLCAVEMESAGVASAAFSALKQIGFSVIRAICDFADESKNDSWHSYAAATAAAYTKTFLLNQPVARSEGGWPRRILETVESEQTDSLSTRQELFQMLCKGLDMEEFKNLCFYLGVDVDDLSGDRKSARVRELILFFEQRGKVDEIVEAFRELFSEFHPPKVSLSKLPTTRRQLFGREKELKVLDAAWADPHTNILSFVAWGGAGKTALVNQWLNQMELDNYREAERVYGWSFYSQGAREDPQTSAERFIADLLDWFEYEGKLPKSSWYRGKLLAFLISQHRTLLILDGLESLQYPTGEMHGKLRDDGIQALLKELSRLNNGLCLITTRCGVKDIEHTIGESTQQIYLEHLSDKAGAQLLKSWGVVGTKAELENVSGEFHGHALALNLLGSYLVTVYNGDVRQRDLIPQLTEDEEQGGHAKRVMRSYENWLNGTLELEILYLVGLFDRPAPKKAIEFLKSQQPVQGLTDTLQNLSESKWQFAVKRLGKLQLLAEQVDHTTDTLDCHPLIRQYFGKKFKEINLKGWKDANNCLYDYFRSLPQKELPDNLEEMEPLLLAVTHGCRAGKYQETFNDIYWKRMCRGEDYYTIYKLGAFGSDLEAISNFFDPPWKKPVSELTDAVKAEIFGIAGFELRALGRLGEAANTVESALEGYIEQKDWKNSAIASCTLSELFLTQGDFKKAIIFGGKGLVFAKKDNNGFMRECSLGRIATSLHNSGENDKAWRCFNKAEKLRKDREGKQFLYSVEGFRYCDLLLSQGKLDEVIKRTQESLKIVNRPLNVSFDHLSLGRAYLKKSQREKVHDFTKASHYLNEALKGFREAGTQHHIPLGLLGRVVFYRIEKNFADAWADLEEVKAISERGVMRLYLTDYHLEAVRLYLVEEQKDPAKWHLDEAKRLIEETGYHRRDSDIKDLERELRVPA